MKQLSEVSFHHGIGDKMSYACRLVRKAYRAGVRLVVTADVQTLRQFDRQLWVFDEQEFLPHVCVTAGMDCPDRWRSTPIWLTDEPQRVPDGLSTLVNLGAALPEAIMAYDRFFDVVSTDSDDRLAGRQRWRQYEAMGLTVKAHLVQEP